MTYEPTYHYLPPASHRRLTPLYDIGCTLLGLGKKFKKKVLDAQPLVGGMTVIDVGCGTGVFLEIAKQKYPGVRFIGIDPDKDALAIAKKRFERAHLDIELIHSFAESLPLENASVDICFSTLAFHHMPDEIKERAIKEIYRVLKPGGAIIIADFGPSDSTAFRKALFFEKLEYIEGNLKGLIPKFLTDTGFSPPEVIGRHWPGIAILTAKSAHIAGWRSAGSNGAARV